MLEWNRQLLTRAPARSSFHQASCIHQHLLELLPAVFFFKAPYNELMHNTLCETTVYLITCPLTQHTLWARWDLSLVLLSSKYYPPWSPHRQWGFHSIALRQKRTISRFPKEPMPTWQMNVQRNCGTYWQWNTTSVIKRNALESVLMKQTHLELIIQSEISQREKQISYTMHIYGN